MFIINPESKFGDFTFISGFDWDAGNTHKNWVKHGVHPKECEAVFYNKFTGAKDIKHSKHEDRYRVLGVTDEGRFLHIVFTLRNNRIRIVSARDQNRKERKSYFDELAN